MSNPAQSCPICLRPITVESTTDYGERIAVRCSCCGRYKVTRTAEAMLNHKDLSAAERAVLMHRIRAGSEIRTILLDSSTLSAWLSDLQLPSPYEQIQNLIRWLADHLPAAGARADLTFDEYQGIIGAADADGFRWVVKEALAHGWIDGTEIEPLDLPMSVDGATLALHGWQFADELRRAKTKSRTAFMAMKFGDAQTDALYRDFFVPAVKQAGFNLRRLDEEQPAGLIDDQLRVAIRNARFLLVDLTHGNKGAYWEAGFAEGLDKPVIYLCRADVFASTDPAVRPHFDTSHLVTIVWKPDAQAEAAERLKACIRATLPAEALMEDPVG